MYCRQCAAHARPLHVLFTSGARVQFRAEIARTKQGPADGGKREAAN
jgi:hypothetical protein